MLYLQYVFIFYPSHQEKSNSNNNNNKINDGMFLPIILAVKCVEPMLDKFKEKKVNVVLALQEALDFIASIVSLDKVWR